MAQPIIVIAEHQDGSLRPTTHELIGFATRLRQFKPGPLQVVLLGSAPEELARGVAAQTGLDVIAVQEAGLVRYNGELYKSILAALLSELNPACVCISHTPRGMDFAPGLAYRLGIGCITGVESVSEEGGCLWLTRSEHAGKILAEIAWTGETVVLTVAPGVFNAAASSSSRRGHVELRRTALPQPRVRTTETRKAPLEESELSDASVIVAAGRGIGQKENLSLVFELAALFPRAAVAGSRWVCDAGWLEHRRQVGLTGAKVSPKLYIACGISGSTQHLAGMREAAFIVAVNSDPHAAIFNIADVCILDDLKTFITALIRERRRSLESI